jgi:hypothetical protein
VRDGALAALATVMTVLAYIEARKAHPWTSSSNS